MPHYADAVAPPLADARSRAADPFEQLSLDELRTRTSGKWRRDAAEVLPLWVAEMDAPLAEPVVAAVTDAVRRGDTGYPQGTAYAEAFAAFVARRYGWDGLDVQASRVVPDVMTGMAELIRVLTAPGDTVVVNAPVYPPFYAVVANTGRRVLPAPLDAGYRLDLAGLAGAYAQATRGGRAAVHLLCSPHNPTGTVHTPAELAAVARLADASGVRVVVDEIHAPLVLPGARFTPYLTLAGTETAVALVSASKAFNVAALKGALAVPGAQAVPDVGQIPVEVGFGASHLGLIAQTAALTDGEPWLDAVLAALAVRREQLGRLLAEQLPAVGHVPPAGTYLAWLDFRAAGLPDGADPASYLLQHARVALADGPPFGPGGAGHARLNFATSTAVLTEAVRRMAAALEAAAADEFPERQGSAR